jgi:hypothetical protein
MLFTNKLEIALKAESFQEAVIPLITLQRLQVKISHWGSNLTLLARLRLRANYDGFLLCMGDGLRELRASLVASVKI